MIKRQISHNWWVILICHGLCPLATKKHNTSSSFSICPRFISSAMVSSLKRSEYFTTSLKQFYFCMCDVKLQQKVLFILWTVNKTIKVMVAYFLTSSSSEYSAKSSKTLESFELSQILWQLGCNFFQLATVRSWGPNIKQNLGSQWTRQSPVFPSFVSSIFLSYNMQVRDHCQVSGSTLTQSWLCPLT